MKLKGKKKKLLSMQNVKTADAEKYRKEYESLDGDYTKEFEKRVT